jgi:hypothetical protein
MLKRHPFIIYFAISFLPFLALNLLGYLAASRCCEGDSYIEVGFPFIWYRNGWVVLPRVMWNGLVEDMLIAVGASLVSAKILKSVFQPNP